MKEPSKRELTRRHIRWQQGASKAADQAHSKKAGYQTRPQPSLPKMPWDDQPKERDDGHQE